MATGGYSVSVCTDSIIAGVVIISASIILTASNCEPASVLVTCETTISSVWHSSEAFLTV